MGSLPLIKALLDARMTALLSKPAAAASAAHRDVATIGLWRNRYVLHFVRVFHGVFTPGLLV